MWSLGQGVVAELRTSRPINAAQFAMLKKYIALAEEAEKTTETGAAEAASSWPVP
jgi:hypothetical protein